MAMTQCRYFNGYKPCAKNDDCGPGCPSLSIPQTRILIIHLEALGAVLRSTALLLPIRRKYQNAHITWITQKPADQLLHNNPLVDRVVGFDPANILALTALDFDVTFCIDKSLAATGLAAHLRTELLFGFKLDRATGSIVPATPAADELWGLGLSNQKKFFENQKAETQLTCEALELGPFQRDSYILKLNESEKTESRTRRRAWLKDSKAIIGLNTGCSDVIAYKKMSVEAHRKLVQKILSHSDFKIVLLGGKEDTNRNLEIARGLDVILSPTDKGMRDGIVSVDACDVIVSGDSLGMHMGIALQKWIVAWFGPTCLQEIDLFDRGVKISSEVTCSPCWKRVCEKSTMCYDLVDTEKLFSGILLGQQGFLSHHGEQNTHHSNGLYR